MKWKHKVEENCGLDEDWAQTHAFESKKVANTNTNMNTATNTNTNTKRNTEVDEAG